MRGEATTPGDDVESDRDDRDRDDRLAGVHGALHRLGRRWALALWSFAGIGSPDGPWIMPILYVAPPLLAVALWRLAELAPQVARRLLRACALLVAPGWALGLWGSLDGGPFSLGQRLAQVCGTVGLTACCGALWSWSRTAGLVAPAAGWAKATRQGGIAVGLLAAIAVVDAAGTGSLVSVGPPEAVSGVVLALAVALLVVVAGALISANLAMKATRAALPAPIPAPPVGRWGRRRR